MPYMNVAMQQSHEYAYPNLVHVAVCVAITIAVGPATRASAYWDHLMRLLRQVVVSASICLPAVSI